VFNFALRHGRRRPPFFAGVRSPEVVLFIIDLESRRFTAPGLLVQLHVLTRREAALAVSAFGRSHLRRIFDKAETSRQVELILLLARLPSGPTKPQTDSD
jgi:hypothetical protein